MSSTELHSFIRTQLERGVPKEHILSDITKQGWSQEAAVEAFREIETGNAPTPPQPPIQGATLAVGQTADASLAGPIELFKRAWKTYTSRLKPILLLSVLPMVVIIAAVFLAGVVGIAGYGLAGGMSGFSQNLELVLGFGGVVLLLLAVLFYVLTWIQLALLAVVRRDGEEQLSVTGALKQSRPLVWRYLWVSLLGGLIIFGGIFLFVIPGIWLAVLFSMMTFMVYFENESGLKALRRSREYVSGYWWPIAGRFGAVVVVMILISLLLQAVLRSETNSAGSLLENVINTFILGPVTVAYFYELYRSLKGVKGEVKTPAGSAAGTLGYVALALLPFVVMFFALAAGISALERLDRSGVKPEDWIQRLLQENATPDSEIDWSGFDQDISGLAGSDMLTRAQLASIGDLIESEYEARGSYPTSLSALKQLNAAGVDLSGYRYKLSNDGSDFSLCTDTRQGELCYSELKEEQLSL